MFNRAKFAHSTAIAIFNTSGSPLAFVISTYSPPDSRKPEAFDEIHAIVNMIALAFENPNIIVYSDFNTDLNKANIVRKVGINEDLF